MTRQELEYLALQCQKDRNLKLKGMFKSSGVINNDSVKYGWNSDMDKLFAGKVFDIRITRRLDDWFELPCFDVEVYGMKSNTARFFFSTSMFEWINLNGSVPVVYKLMNM